MDQSLRLLGTGTQQGWDRTGPHGPELPVFSQPHQTLVTFLRSQHSTGLLVLLGRQDLGQGFGAPLSISPRLS